MSLQHGLDTSSFVREVNQNDRNDSSNDSAASKRRNGININAVHVLVVADPPFDKDSRTTRSHAMG